MWTRRRFLETASALPFVGGLIGAHGAATATARLIVASAAALLPRVSTPEKGPSSRRRHHWPVARLVA